MMKRKIAAFLCLVMCICSFAFPTAAQNERDITEHEICAGVLKQLGLFRGVSETDFDLERAPTRIEALVMLVRVLGKEQDALNGTWRHPFTDVPSWADPYVGYAYVNGLTNGVSPTEFGGGDAGAATYLTFMLRALGYSDAGGLDFTWDNPYALAEGVGILVDGIDTENFWRADVAGISYLALFAYLKDSSDTLADKLIAAGAFTMEQYSAAMNMDMSGEAEPDESTETTAPETTEPVTPPPTSGEKLNAEQIADKCAPAVFYVEVYGYNGAIRGSGSGFFITENGYAITNFHVVENSSHLTVTTTDGKKYENVKVVDVDREKDLALLKISASVKFPYLEMGDSDAVKQGQTVYAIGSPRGLENTLSQGIVSNHRRTVNEQVYIQLSAQIDSGSSGGALINDYGKVIGVTTAIIVDNTADLNLAVPMNNAKVLNKNNTEEPVLWNINGYDLEAIIDNFGYITGIDRIYAKVLPRGIEIQYDAKDVAPSDRDRDPLNTCLKIYGEILKEGGATVASTSGYVTKYTAVEDGERINISVILDKTANTITVRLEVAVKYYANTSKIPDFGWYTKLEQVDYTRSGQIHDYKYKYSDKYTPIQVNSVFLAYELLLEEQGITYVGDATLSDGSASVYRGNGHKVYGSFDDTYIYITITPDNYDLQMLPAATLGENIKAKGTYDSKSGSYKCEKTISKVLYAITYTEKSGTICFSSEETVSASNLGIAKSLGMNVSGSSTATLKTSIYLNQDGSTTVTFVCSVGNHIFRYEGAFNRYSFSQNSTLTAISHTGPTNLPRDVHDKIVSQMVRTLNGCGSYVLKNLGVTFKDLGFLYF